ncbi:type II toxin-antitoxin system RelE/ParE family toxin [Vibrio mangrovi]|uniref:Type II toxin-antitoxin system RelE/ParE family toxin n=1 Tax=Vibrio mangrovi TaxID=474394 RepID=A0A1Y6IYA0_9VIBR|nr:type II toxin-antitoxin system RelE/ParE family toxin [Vibrio mangrovi]MDW6004732.1 type II toxin-antitoxin system RelE/ParE family toxin [Vibrio mangrovi]SMS01023.1 hypothetical protein VIM7927_02300 [Vibrio mangrovi]
MAQKQHVVIQTTESFDKTVDNAIVYLSQWSDEIQVIERIEGVLDRFEQCVTEHPYAYSRCPELVEMGVNTVRNANIHDFRLLYEVEPQGDRIVIHLLLLLRTRQSIEKQLIEFCLYQ